MHSERHIPTSELLESIAAEALADDADDAISLGEFIDKLTDRGFGLILLICAIPNLLPVNLPGVSTIFSVVIVFFTVQWMLGLGHPWLPERIRRRQFSEKNFASAIMHIAPKLRRMEHLIKPRGAFMHARAGIILTGVCIMIQTLILALPLPMIPFSNAIPAFFIMLIALGILSRDGWLILAAITTGTTAIYFLALGIMVALSHMWEWLMGMM